MYLSWQEIWCVRLHHNAVQRDLPDSISGLGGLEVRDEGRETHIQVGELRQEGLNHRITVCETVPGNTGEKIHRLNS